MVVHVILNSHLDPIWLWNLEQGIDAALATARTACDILDDYPEAHVTRGEAWFYETVERFDPATFRRMLAHVAAGRLHPIGGWYVQPDCNLASPETYRLHAEVSLPYFRDVVGAEIRTGYNVDSFGHGAFLPDFYAAAGIENYIMMRPQPHEKELPGEVFRWRSPSGAELLTARIPTHYASTPACVAARMEKAAEQAGAAGQGLFFCGVGDHGGGPAREEIEYVAVHRNAFPGVEFRFSHPDAFFEAVRSDAETMARLPVVTGELQHHAIGCYAAFSPVKRALRSAEALFHRSARRLPKRACAAAARSLLFATFHDVLAGTCVESAYPAILDRLGAVRAGIADAEVAAVRRRNAALPRDPRQRIVVDNFGDTVFSGLAEFEPWLSDTAPERLASMRILGPDGKVVPHQAIPVESLSFNEPRILFPARVPAHGRRIFHIDFAGRADGTTATAAGAAAPRPRAFLDGLRPPWPLAALSFDVLADATDTWSHDFAGYAAKASRVLRPSRKGHVLYEGPLATATLSDFADGRGNSVQAACRTEAGLSGMRLRLRATWVGAREILKLSLKPGFPVVRRIDSVPGGEIARALDGEEYPLYRAIRLLGAGGEELAVLSEDVFSCDVQRDGTLRLTLLRTPYFAHHRPMEVPDRTMAPVTDLGVHDFALTILDNPPAGELERERGRLSKPLRYSETTGAARRGETAPSSDE